MLMEIKPNYKLYAKTGWGIENENGINYGLYIGFLEIKITLSSLQQTLKLLPRIKNFLLPEKK